MKDSISHERFPFTDGGMDTLPLNGAVINLLTMTELTHKYSYSDIFAITCLKFAAVFVVIAGFYFTGI